MTLTNWIVVVAGTWVAGAALTAWNLMEFGDLGQRPVDIADVLMIGFGPVTLAVMVAQFAAVKLGLVELDRRRR
jgi:hypothetical protein